MTRMLTIVCVALIVVFPCFVLGELCQNQYNCHDCEHETTIWVPDNCRWCELDRKCHTYGSITIPCEHSMDVTDDSECPPDSNDTIPYDQKKAFYFAQLSAVAYAEPTDLKRCLMKLGCPYCGADFENISGISLAHDFEFIEYIGKQCNIEEINYKDCFVFIGMSRVYKNIVISFRGTTDFDQLKDELYNFGLQTLDGDDTKVNGYFKNAFTKLYPCLLNNLKKLLLNYSDYKVVVTGHSLGGAIASLTAYSLVTEGVIAKEKLHLYTFGMPRVGNKKYAYNHDKIVPNSWRIIHAKDWIARLPLKSLGYYHHREPVLYFGYMGPNNPYLLQHHLEPYASFQTFTDNEDSVLTDGLPSISDHKIYFGIPMGTYCEDTLPRLQKRSTRFHFPKDQCLVVSLRDAEELPSNAALGIMYKPLLYTTVGVLLLAMHVW